jgi:putative hydrolase of the HAD superfamily
VLFDLGGVILTSPFEEFSRYEAAAGLPAGTVRRINSTDPDTNAWARLERNEVALNEFVAAFEDEGAALGVQVDGWKVLACLRGQVRPEMHVAVERCSEVFTTGLLTNNFVSWSDASGADAADDVLKSVLACFDAVVESSVVGVRKPEPRFYELALEQLGVAAADSVFLDDLGVNLKPARAMGMTTIKVTDPVVALAELAEVTGLDLL